jgi:hypothetical protein
MSVARDEKLAELDAWLSRLVGKFRVEAYLDNTVVRCHPTCELLRVSFQCAGRECKAIRQSSGAGDCDRVGDGPGVHCIINVPWLQPVVFTPPPPLDVLPEARTTTIPWPGRILEPATILFGIDPDNPAVRYLLVDGKSIAEEASGSLQGDTVTFTAECVNESVTCRQKLSILAPEDGGRIRMTLNVSFRT